MKITTENLQRRRYQQAFKTTIQQTYKNSSTNWTIRLNKFFYSIVITRISDKKKQSLIGFILLYFKMVVVPLVPDTKMVDVRKLISVGNLLVRKVTWLVLTTTSATLILSRAFGADCMTRIAYIYSRLPSTHSLTFFTYRDSTLSLILSIATFRDNTLSLLHFDFQPSTPRKCVHSTTFFFVVLFG